MKKVIKENGAFTLIELLVVILIIGILTAVAVPMYKRAVLKSRFATVMPLAKAIAQGNETYYLANGEYATQLPKLAIDKPEGDTAGVLVGLQSTEYFNYVLGTRQGMNNNYIMYQKHSPNFSGNIHCEAKTDDPQAHDLCKALGGTQIGGSQTENYTTYILQGNAEDGHLPTTYTGDNGITLYAGDSCISTTSNATDCINTYKEGSRCVGKAGYSCSGGTYDNATCYSMSSSSCDHSTFENNSICTDQGRGSNNCVWSTFDDSECRGTSGGSCWLNTFKNGSSCTGSASGSCVSNKFIDAECVGNGESSCGKHPVGHISSFDNSICQGNGVEACSNNKFVNNSKCIVNNVDACTNNTYSTGAGCQATEGFTCPAGTPKTNSWDAENNTYTSDGWNGGCCNPAYMVGGTCPANATVCN